MILAQTADLVGNESRMDTFKRIWRFMPYDTFQHMHQTQLKQRILCQSQEEEQCMPPPITQAMMRDFDNQSIVLGSVHSDLGKRAYNQLKPDNVSMTSSVAPVGDISDENSSPMKK